MTDAERRARRVAAQKKYAETHREQVREYQRNYKRRIRNTAWTDTTPRCPVCHHVIGVNIDCPCPPQEKKG